MKKTLLIGFLSLLWFITPVKAQLEKGTKYLGGTIGLNGQTYKYDEKDTKSDTRSGSGHTISPEMQWGYFLNSSTMIGLGARYSFQWNRSQYDLPGQKNRGNSHSVQLLPFIRKYKTLGDHWAVFFHAEIGPSHTWSKSKVTGDYAYESKIDYWRHTVSIKPGLSYLFPKKGWVIEGYADVLSLNASYLVSKEGPGEAKNFMFSSGISTDFPTYFSIRVAKYLTSPNK